MSDNHGNDTAESFKDFCKTIAALRHPVTGCPWDLEQTHASLRRYMIEEAYEAAEVMDPVDPKKLCEELGDVLLQVVLNSQLAKDEGTFTVDDVINGINQKMRRRHPHVFGDKDTDTSQHSREASAIRAKWEEIKASEARAKGQKPSGKPGVFDHLKPGSMSPASQLAVAIGKTAKNIAFDWDTSKAVFDQFQSEVKELKDEIDSGRDKAKIYEEMGDVMFSLSQLCRHLDVDPEICAMDGNKKFLKRFQNLEQIAKAESIDVTTAGTAKLEELWLKAKKLEAKRK
jgi:MazG family protein